MQIKAKITEHHQVARDIFLMTLFAPKIAVSAKAGQFIHIKCSDSLDPLLRRPFSLSIIDKEAGSITIIYEVRGRGTKLLSKFCVGQELDILGPLGNSFLTDDSSNGKAVLVGGGIGSPPMIALAQTLLERGISDVTVLLGAVAQDKLIPEGLFDKKVKLLFATDDGSKGHKGFVTELLPKETLEKGQCSVYACGPDEMLKTVAKYCLINNIPCRLSLEAIMACGVGACQGCVCKVLGEPEPDYVRVCAEGPVFDALEVMWDE